MLAKPLRTKRQRASAERCVRPLGAMIAMATPIVKTSERSSEGRIFASRFTKRQVRYRGGYEVLSTSGNCWASSIVLLGLTDYRRPRKTSPFRVGIEEVGSTGATVFSCVFRFILGQSRTSDTISRF